jgi:hypothetical protein
MMTDESNAAAALHLPFFITPPGQTDSLMVAMGVFLIVSLVMVGVFYLKLHALPEHLAHKGQKVQFQIVAVLGLLALFTHNHAFWIAGLLLALIQLPDISNPLSSITKSLETIAGRQPSPEPADAAQRRGGADHADVRAAEAPAAPQAGA